MAEIGARCSVSEVTPASPIPEIQILDKASLNQLRIRGIGATDVDRRLLAHFTPCAEPRARSMIAPAGFSSSCATAFRAALQDSRRNAEPMDPHLYVNPIQNASKADTVHIPGYQRMAHVIETSTVIDYQMPADVSSPRARQQQQRAAARPDANMQRKRVLDQVAHSGLVTKRNRLEHNEASAAALLAGTVWPYTAKPKTLLLLQKTKSDIELLNKQVWHPEEDAAMLALQEVLDDPHFVLTASVISRLPGSSQGIMCSAHRVKERFEKLEKNPKVTGDKEREIEATVRRLRVLCSDCGLGVRAHGGLIHERNRSCTISLDVLHRMVDVFTTPPVVVPPVAVAGSSVSLTIGTNMAHTSSGASSMTSKSTASAARAIMTAADAAVAPAKALTLTPSMGSEQAVAPEQSAAVKIASAVAMPFLNPLAVMDLASKAAEHQMAISYQHAALSHAVAPAQMRQA